MIEETGTKKTLKIFVLADTSEAMSVGGRIESLNAAMEEVIPELREAQENNVFADMQIQVIDFSTGAQFVDGEVQCVNDFTWRPMVASGDRDLGTGLRLLKESLSVERMGLSGIPPVVILMMCGTPTDDCMTVLNELNQSPWGKARRTTRVGIAIGEDADRDVLATFTGNIETVFAANQTASLTSLIRWDDIDILDDRVAPVAPRR